jgi:hypothetical protein
MSESMVKRVASVLGHVTDCAIYRVPSGACDCGAAQKALEVIAEMRAPTDAMSSVIDKTAWQQAIDEARSN